MRYGTLTALALPALAVLLTACLSDPAAPDMKWADPTTISYYPGLHVDLSRMTKTSSGVFYWDSIAGTGGDTVKVGDRITIRYKVWLPDGTLADSAQSVTLRLLSDSTISGFVDGMTGTVLGATRQLVIPPTAAYGAGGNGRIPPYATTIFLVTVNGITHVTSSAAVVPITAPAGEVSVLTSALATAFARSHRSP